MSRYVYKFTSPNGLYYIGKHKWSGEGLDPNYKGSSKNSKYWDDINSYGWDSFEKVILCYCDSDEDLSNKEVEYIKLYDSTNPSKGYNLVRYSGDWDSINSNPDLHAKGVAIRKVKGSYANSADHLVANRSIYNEKRWTTWYKNGKHSDQADRLNTKESKERANISRNEIKKFLRSDGSIYIGRSCSARRISNNLGEHWVELGVATEDEISAYNDRIYNSKVDRLLSASNKHPLNNAIYETSDGGIVLKRVSDVSRFNYDYKFLCYVKDADDELISKLYKVTNDQVTSK